MFGIIKIFSSKKPAKEDSTVKFANTLKEKSQSFSSLLGDKFEQAKNEFFTIKDKCNNLLETNYNLGEKHLARGNLKEAVFRFRFIKKFWPKHYDSQYKLAYCLTLDKKPEEAKKVLEELLIQNPDYDPQAKELLDLINSATAGEVVEEEAPEEDIGEDIGEEVEEEKTPTNPQDPKNA